MYKNISKYFFHFEYKFESQTILENPQVSEYYLQPCKRHFTCGPNKAPSRNKILRLRVKADNILLDGCGSWETTYNLTSLPDLSFCSLYPN